MSMPSIDRTTAARLAGERKQIERMSAGLAKRLFTLPWLTVPPIGFVEQSKLVSATSPAAAAQTRVPAQASRRHTMYGFTTVLTGTSFDQALANAKPTTSITMLPRARSARADANLLGGFDDFGHAIAQPSTANGQYKRP